MTQSAIAAKLTTLLMEGITTERDAFYFVGEIRKLLEQQQAKPDYEYLKFHCDWALHSALNGKMAQRLLDQFDAANAHLRRGIDLHDLPGVLQKEIDRISKMTYFREELARFLEANRLPPLEAARSDGWIHFLHLYAQIVQDSPLVMRATNTCASIESVTLSIELAKHPQHGHRLFKVGWFSRDKNGKTGEIFVLNSFEAKA